MSKRYEITRYWRLGFGIATVVHLSLAVGVLYSQVLGWCLPGLPRQATKPPPLTFVSQPADLKEPPAVDLQTGTEAPTPSIAEFVRSQVETATRETEQITDAENVVRLRQMSEKLQAISSPDSLNQLSAQFRNWIGTKERSENALPTPAQGEFDFRTAQLHDVLRSESSSGEFSYASILIDAQGQTMKVPLTEEQGNRLYSIWELVKANPLLERVYRQIVMGLLDQMAE